MRLRLRHTSIMCLIGLAVPLACGSGSAPSLTPEANTMGLPTGGTSAAGDTSAGGTPGGGGTTSANGAQSGEYLSEPAGGSGPLDASGGVGGGGMGTGGKASGGFGTGGKASGGVGGGGTGTGGRASGGTSSTGGSGDRPSGGDSSTETCTDNLNPEQPETSCATWKEWGNCDQSWMIDNHICDRTCGRCSGGSSGGGSTGGNNNSGSGGTSNISNVNGGQQGFATRYWDCCRPTCGWTEHASHPVSSCDRNNQSLGGDYGAQSACSGGNAYMCWGWAPWSVSSNLSYGFVAFNGAGCGTCYQLDFSGDSHNPNNDAGSQSLAGKHMIVQVINTGGIEGGQFDLLVPGGGVGQFINACSDQWGTSDLGEQYGGFFLACQNQNKFDYEPSRSCATSWCQKVFSGKQELLNGCLWYVDWFGMADNPNLTYGQVSCPREITAISGM